MAFSGKRLSCASGQKYILGFNEPDHVNQANMTLKAAADLWPQLVR
jgi:hypothetical protein